MCSKFIIAGFFAACVFFHSYVIAAPAATMLDAPAQDAKRLSTSPTLIWHAASGATSYRLQVSESADFSSTLYDQDNITDTSKAIDAVLENSSIKFGTPYQENRSIGFGMNDQPYAYFIKPDGVTYRSWQTVFNPEGQLYEGPLDAPTQSNPGSYGWSWNGITDHNGAWVMRAYQADGDTLIGFIHQEGGTYDFYFGLAVSFDLGDSWTFCGDILCPVPITNVGGGAVLTVDGYFYVYFNDGGPCVARAPMADVIAAAKQKTLVPWFKYKDGAWNADPFTVRGSRLFSVTGSPSSADLHTHATYVKSTGTYLIGVNNQGNNSRCLVFASPDGINWGNQYTVFTGGSINPYGTFVGTRDGGSRNDQFEQGDSFWYYWDCKGLNSPGDYNDDNFMRVKIDVTPKVYYWRVAASDAGGFGEWSETRKFTTIALIDGGGEPVGVSPAMNDNKQRASFSATIQQTSSGRLRVTIAGASREFSDATVSLYDMSGRCRASVTDKYFSTGSHAVEFGVLSLSPGRYSVRIQAPGTSETVSAIVLR